MAIRWIKNLIEKEDKEFEEKLKYIKFYLVEYNNRLILLLKIIESKITQDELRLYYSPMESIGLPFFIVPLTATIKEISREEFIDILDNKQDKIIKVGEIL